MRMTPLTSELCRQMGVEPYIVDMGPGVVFYDDNDHPIAAVGIAMLWPGVGEVWVTPIDKLPLSKLLYICRNMENLLDEHVKIDSLHRLHSHVKANDNIARRFAKHFKFCPEALLEKFGPEGADYISMVRFF